MLYLLRWIHHQNVEVSNSIHSTARAVLFVKRLQLWRWMRDYFPVSCIKTTDLDPSRNYIFGYHPHGIIGLGAWINFATG